MRGVYPGTFNPPTVGHIEIVRAAFDQLRLERLDLVVSRRPLAKQVGERPTLDERIEVIRSSVSAIPGVSVVVTEHQLIADIAAGYDTVVMGADKWVQLHDVAFYEDDAHRARALASLPRLAVVDRGEVRLPPHVVLDVAADIDEISSTGARTGRWEWMTDEALASGHWS